MAQTGIAIGIKVTGWNETLAAFRGLPKEASAALRDESTKLATTLAGRVANAARGDSPQSALMAPTVRARRDRVPVIEAGGTSRVGSRSKPAYKILFGSEFGARTYRQFRPHVGRGSYWMFKTVLANQSAIDQAWNRVATDIERYFSLPTPGERIAEIAGAQHAAVEDLFSSVHVDFDALMGGGED